MPQLHLVVYVSLVRVAYGGLAYGGGGAAAELHIARQTPMIAAVTATDASTPSTADAATKSTGPATIGRAAAMHTNRWTACNSCKA